MKVKFVPQNVEIEIQNNESVLHLAHVNNIHIQSVCKGIPSCAECRIRVTEGSYNVLPPSSTEVSLIGNSYFIDGRRLACQLRCFGDITVDLTEQIEKEERASKKPRGKAIKAAEESRAVMGSILFDEEKARPGSQVSEAALASNPAEQDDGQADVAGGEMDDLDVDLPMDPKAKALARALRDED